MSSLTAPRYAQQVGDLPVISKTSYPIADNVKMYDGGIACLQGGYLVPGQVATGLVAAGIVQSGLQSSLPGVPSNTLGVWDNTISGHSAGAFNVPVTPGVWQLDIYASDAVTQADVGNVCFIYDDHTIARTDGNGARSPAGILMGIDSSSQAIVSIGLQVSKEGGNASGGEDVYPEFMLSIPIPALSALANASQPVNITPGIAGRLKSIQFQVTTPVTTGSKLATLQAEIAGSATTGGAIALTSANCTPMGANVAGSAITAGNTFTAAQAIEVVASSVTAFVEGAGVVVLTFG